METLLQGYDEQDEDQVYRVCNSPLLKYMDNDVSTRGFIVIVFFCFFLILGSRQTSGVKIKFDVLAELPQN